MSAEWCLRHATRLDEANVPRYISETIVVQKVLDGNLLAGIENGCWACALPEVQFQDAIREAAVLDAQVAQHGGMYTNEKIAISRPQGYALPTDKESNQK